MYEHAGTEREAALAQALEYAVLIIDSYALDIRHSAFLDVELVDVGFCQGSIYKGAHEAIDRIVAGESKPYVKTKYDVEPGD
jgi:hypothetical protein